MKAYTIAILLLLSCAQPNEKTVSLPAAAPHQSEKQIFAKAKTSDTLSLPAHVYFPWQHEVTFPSNNLLHRIALPQGYQRIALAKGSFGEWLRHLPLYDKQRKVKLYDGRDKPSQQLHQAVVRMDVGNADLQQCADAIMRLVAEYHYSKKEYAAIHFNYTSGHRISFDDWRKGKRPVVQGNKVTFVKNGRKSDDYNNFKTYLRNVFSYAGTASFSKELKPKAIQDIMPGDIFIQGGFPGHAVLVLDVATNAQDEKIFLIGQSYMPAQDFHILKNLENENLSPWYKINDGEKLYTPEWTFDWKDLKTR